MRVGKGQIQWNMLVLGALCLAWPAAGASKDRIIVEYTVPQLENERVGKEMSVKGSAELPDGNHLWVLVHRIKGFKTVWWPQSAAEVDPATREWEANVVFGGEQDIGEDFEIAAITVNETEHLRLQQYWEKAMETGKWTPMKMPATTSPPKIRRVKKVSHD